MTARRGKYPESSNTPKRTKNVADHRQDDRDRVRQRHRDNAVRPNKEAARPLPRQHPGREGRRRWVDHLAEESVLDESHQCAGTEHTDELVGEKKHYHEHRHPPDRVHGEASQPVAQRGAAPALDVKHLLEELDNGPLARAGDGGGGARAERPLQFVPAPLYQLQCASGEDAARPLRHAAVAREQHQRDPAPGVAQLLRQLRGNLQSRSLHHPWVGALEAGHGGMLEAA